jgi:hypothetical protein
MPIKTATSILPGSNDPIADADVIQTANVVGYTFERMAKGRKVHFDSEGDAHKSIEPDDDHSFGVWNAARRDEYVEVNMLAELAQLVFPLADRYVDGSTRGNVQLGPLKALFPSIVGSPSNYGEDGLSDFELQAERDALAYCRQLGDGPYPQGIGYRSYGAYTGVVRWGSVDNPEFEHFSTTRRVMTNADKHSTRWHPDSKRAIGRMAPIGAREAERRYGMQATNKQQKTINEVENMPFVGTPGDGDVVSYNHGLPQAIVALEASSRLGIPMEVVGASPEQAWADRTKKTASCFQCTVYMDACGYPPSSIHLGRGESWAPPYARDYPDHPHRAGAAAACLRNWNWLCYTNLRKGVDILRETSAVTDPVHKASLECLKSVLDRIDIVTDGGRTAADLILDASAIHDKDYMKVLRALWPTSETRTLADVVADYQDRAEDEYPSRG